MKHRYHFGQQPEMPWKQACDPWEGLSPTRRWYEIQRAKFDGMDKELLAARLAGGILFMLFLALLRYLR